jgi:hypothetical protein
MNELLDDELREHGRTWQAAQPPPQSFDEAMVRATAQRDHRVLLAVAAAVVVVLVAVGVPFVRSLGGNGNSAPAPAMRSATVASPAPTSASPVHSVVQDSVGRTISELRERARVAAIGNQDPAATAEAVRTTYRQAERVAFGGDTSSSPSGDTSVWVIQLHGRFVCDECKGPVGSNSPKGTAIVLVLNARTFDGYDFGLSQKPVDLAKLGKVVQLPM